MAEEALLSEVPAAPHPMDGDTCDAARCESLRREHFPDGVWFDFAVHGQGHDGHVGSLFPGKPEVGVTDRLVVEVPDPGGNRSCAGSR